MHTLFPFALALVLSVMPAQAQSDPLGANPMDRMLDQGTSRLNRNPVGSSGRPAAPSPQRAGDYEAQPGMSNPGADMNLLAPAGAPPPMPAAPAQSPVDGGLALLLGAGAIYAVRRLRNGHDDAPVL